MKLHVPTSSRDTAKPCGKKRHIKNIRIDVFCQKKAVLEIASEGGVSESYSCVELVFATLGVAVRFSGVVLHKDKKKMRLLTQYDDVR